MAAVVAGTGDPVAASARPCSAATHGVSSASDTQSSRILHALREQAGRSQASVAADIGVSQGWISKVERGSRPASDRILRYYGERFGSSDLLASLAEIARESDRERSRLRDPLLIARQARYPLDGDEATFVAETPPDGVAVPCGEVFTKAWTVRNSGSVPWRNRRVRRVGPTTGPWTLTSDRFAPVPDADPGDTIAVSVELEAPQMETAAAAAQWKMVDENDLLYFPTKYSVGLAIYVTVGHDGSPDWESRRAGDRVG